MSFGNYLEDEILDHIFGCGTRDYTSPTNIYIALSTADPTDDGSGMTEPDSEDGYARVSTDGSDWSVSSGGTVANSEAITFAESTGAWGTITHFGLYDAETDGNFLAGGELTASQEVASGKIVSFPVGNLDISLT